MVTLLHKDIGPQKQKGTLGMLHPPYFSVAHNEAILSAYAPPLPPTPVREVPDDP